MADAEMDEMGRGAEMSDSQVGCRGQVCFSFIREQIEWGRLAPRGTL